MQKVPTSNTEGGWSFSLAEYVRHNDMPIYEASERVLRAFQDELMPAESFSEYLDVVGVCSHLHTCMPIFTLSEFNKPRISGLMHINLGIFGMKRFENHELIV